MHSSFSISRRSLLRTGAFLGLSALSPSGRASPSTVREIRMAAAPAAAALSGNGNTDVWAYDGRIPGPELRLRQGEPVRLIIENHLDQDTTVHWHGIRLPNAMDGVPGLTQPPIRPGEFVRLRVHAARCRNLLVPPACQQPGAAGPRPRRRAYRRREGASPGRPRRCSGCWRTGVSTGRARSRPASAT